MENALRIINAENGTTPHVDLYSANPMGSQSKLYQFQRRPAFEK